MSRGIHDLNRLNIIPANITYHSLLIKKKKKGYVLKCAKVCQKLLLFYINFMFVFKMFPIF